MSELLGIIDTIKNDQDATVWVYCQPITESAPKDMPKIVNATNKYWTSQILKEKNDNIEPVTDWFSIPYSNIQTTVKTNAHGPLLIKYNRLGEELQENIFKDTSPVFSLGKGNDGEPLRWINRKRNGD